MNSKSLLNGRAGWLPVLAVAVVLLVGAVAGVGLNAPPAAASATGCTVAPGGSVCARIEGSGTWVSSGSITRYKASWDFICNYSGGLYAYWPGGGGGFLTYAHRDGCSAGAAWFNWAINRRLPANTLVCGYFYEAGVQQGGGACNWVR